MKKQFKSSQMSAKNLRDVCEFCLFLSSEIALEEITFVKNKSTIISGVADCRLRDHSLWKKLEKVLGIIRPFVHCMSCLPRWGFLRMFLSRICESGQRVKTRHLVSLSEELFGSWLLICQLNQCISTNIETAMLSSRVARV